MEDAAMAPRVEEDLSSGSPIFYLNGRRKVKTDSSVLISSSRWLNDARIREWVSTESLRKNGHDYPLLYGLPTLINAVDETRDMDQANRVIAEERRRNPRLDQWFGERFVSKFTKDDLRAYPEGSVGRLLFEYMDAHDLSPELDPRILADPNWAPASDIEYYNLRMSQTHDFYHIIAEIGFGSVAEYFITGAVMGDLYTKTSPDFAGEAFLLNNLIMLPWIMRTHLHYPGAWPTMWRDLSHGYRVGEQSDLMFTAIYEPVLELTPAQARKALGWRGFEGPTDSAAGSIIFGEGREIIQ